MNDAEYLAELGIDAEGNPLKTEGEAAAAPAPEAAKTPEQQAIEELIFEAGGKQFKVPANAELSLKHAGQMVRKPVNSIINGWRQLGDYNHKLAEIDRRNKEYDTKYKGLEKFEQLQKWSEENPDLFQWVWSNYENRDRLSLHNKLGALSSPGQTASDTPSTGSIDPRVIEVIESLQKELSGLKEFKTNFEKQQEEQSVEADIKRIDSEIQGFQKYLDDNFAHANIKLDSQDENGIKLQSKIIKFGIDNKLPDFESAALKYLKDTLIQQAAAKARSETVENVKQQTRQGILATSSTPFAGQSEKVTSGKGKSYEQLASEAKRELAELGQ